MNLKGNVVIWGTEKVCSKVLDHLKKASAVNITLVDSHEKKWGLKKRGYRIVPPDRIKEIDPELVIIASYARSLEIFDEVRKRLPLANVISVARLLGRETKKYPQVLELAITDFCNLKCPFCSQGTPLQKNKSLMNYEEIERISRLIGDNEFDHIKISGGEPTIHPEFRKITKALRKLFKAKTYIIATNGARLLEYRDIMSVYDTIDLSLYPGQNDQSISKIRQQMPELRIMVKTEKELHDINIKPNVSKKDIYERCPYKSYKKIVDGRIYQCCILIGECIRKEIPVAEVSVPMDENWRENLLKIGIEKHCRGCFVDIDKLLL